jgi:hypothetical protein
MLWPDELIAAFRKGVKVKPAEGLTPDDVVRLMLDEVARRAVWRAKGDPSSLRAALETPYTPLGAVTAECVDGLAQSLALGGTGWIGAVRALNDYMEKNAAAVCASFKDEAQPYDSDIGFGF